MTEHKEGVKIHPFAPGLASNVNRKYLKMCLRSNEKSKTLHFLYFSRKINISNVTYFS